MCVDSVLIHGGFQFWRRWQNNPQEQIVWVDCVMRFTVADQKLQPWCGFFIITISFINTWCILEHVSSNHSIKNITCWFHQSETHNTLDNRPDSLSRIVVKDCLLKLNISLASFLWRRLVLPNRMEVSSSTVHAEDDCLPVDWRLSLNCFANCWAAWINQQTSNLTGKKIWRLIPEQCHCVFKQISYDG